MANVCNEKPCENKGVCQLKSLDEYSCACPLGFIGKNCEKVDHCALRPCANNGKCTSLENGKTKTIKNITQILLGFSCDCPPEFTGERCLDDVDECALGNPCPNGVACTNLFGSYQCQCPDGYAGKDCTVPYSPCVPGTCLNGGTCQVEAGGSYR